MGDTWVHCEDFCSSNVCRLRGASSVLHKMKNDTQHLQTQFLFLMVQKLVFSQVHLMLHKMAPNTYTLCSGIYLFPRTEMQDADKIPLLCDADAYDSFSSDIHTYSSPRCNMTLNQYPLVVFRNLSLFQMPVHWKFFWLWLKNLVTCQFDLPRTSPSQNMFGKYTFEPISKSLWETHLLWQVNSPCPGPCQAVEL